jgi:hypothetical protein
MENKATEKFIWAMIGVTLLCVAPIFTTVLTYLLANYLLISPTGTAFFCILGAATGIPLATFGIGAIADGKNSWLADMYRRFDESEKERIRQLEEQQAKLLVKPKRTRKKKDEYIAEAWKGEQ